MTDWHAWHNDYDDPSSNLAQRLEQVRGHIDDWLTHAPDRPLRIIAACSGESRDLLPILARHPDRQVHALCVENDPGLVATARAAAAALPHAIEIREGDAGDLRSYDGGGPADLLLLCGVFGNIVDEDIQRTIAATASLCAPGATVLWTRGRWRRDAPTLIRGWWRDAGFTEVAFDAPVGTGTDFTVGRVEWSGETTAPPDDPKLFTFVGRATLRKCR